MAKGTDKLDSQIARESTAETDLRVYKKSSPNSLLTLYLGTRDVICREGSVEPLRGVVFIDPKFMPSNKIYSQLTLTFRYGREDEEVMGLKFCNEAIIALKQIWPIPDDAREDLSTLQQALLDRLGKNAVPFSLDVGSLAPPSVQLVPAKRYNGAPIGTSYDVRIHMGDPHDDRPTRRCMVKLGVRVIHKIAASVRCPAELTSALNAPTPHHVTTVLMPKTLRLRMTTTVVATTTTVPTVPSDDTAIAASAAADDVAVAAAAGGSNNDGAATGQQCDNSGKSGTSENSAAGRLDSGKAEPMNGNKSGSSTNGAPQSRVDVKQQQHGRQPAGAATNDAKGPEGSVDKPFLWTEGRVSLRAALNKTAYGHGEHISVSIDVRNNSRKIIRKIRIFAVQHVDVCMFSNGKFKNVVAEINESLIIKPGEHHRKVYSLLPIRGPTKNWIAVEGSQSHGTGIGGICTATGGQGDCSHSAATLHQQYNYKIAASAPRGPSTCTEDRNVFAIYVSYYIKVKLTLSAMGGEVTLKLPFILGHVEEDGSYVAECARTARPNATTKAPSSTIESSPDKGAADAQPAAGNADNPGIFEDADVAVSTRVAIELSAKCSVDNETVKAPHNDDADVDNVAAVAVTTAKNASHNIIATSTLDDIVVDTVVVPVVSTSVPAGGTSAVMQFGRRASSGYGKAPVSDGDDAVTPPTTGAMLNIVTAQVHSSAN